MKLGLILESPKDGTDHQVYELVIKRLRSELTVDFTGFHNKKEMLFSCGTVAKTLFDTGFDKVAIIWDLIPTWGGKPCLHNDIEKITTNLQNAEVDLSEVKLICIEPELEGWIITEKNALEQYQMERYPTHIQRFNPPRIFKTTRICKPVIERYLGSYNDMTEAKKIVEKIMDFDRVAQRDKTKSFKRFKDFVKML
jgi:hypothetical protein